MTHYRDTKHGFEFGDMIVERLHLDDKFGSMIEIVTSRKRVQIQVTPKGLIKVSMVMDRINRDKHNNRRAVIQAGKGDRL